MVLKTFYIFFPKLSGFNSFFIQFSFRVTCNGLPALFWRLIRFKRRRGPLMRRIKSHSWSRHLAWLVCDSKYRLAVACEWCFCGYE